MSNFKASRELRQGAAPRPAAAAGSCDGAALVHRKGAAIARRQISNVLKGAARENLTKNFKFPRKFIKNLTLKIKFSGAVSQN